MNMSATAATATGTGTTVTTITTTTTAIHTIHTTKNPSTTTIYLMPIDAVKTRMMIRISGSEIDGGGGRIFSGMNSMNSSGISSNASNSGTSTSSSSSSSSGTPIHNTNVGNSVGNSNTSTIRTSTNTSTNVRTNTMLSAFSTILKEGGVGGFYRGFTPALMRQGPCILLQVRFQNTTSSTYSISVYIYVFFC